MRLVALQRQVIACVDQVKNVDPIVLVHVGFPVVPNGWGLIEQVTDDYEIQDVYTTAPVSISGQRSDVFFLLRAGHHLECSHVHELGAP